MVEYYMKRDVAQIRCAGYFEEDLTNLDRIEQVMAEIEEGSIRRPEFELVFPIGGKMPPVYAAALFREGGDVFVEGWFLWHILKGSPDNAVYCIKNCEERKTGYKHVLRCGAPEAVNTSAILSRIEAAKLLKSLAKGEPTMGFEKRSYGSVLWRDEKT